MSKNEIAVESQLGKKPSFFLNEDENRYELNLSTSANSALDFARVRPHWEWLDPLERAVRGWVTTKAQLSWTCGLQTADDARLT